MITSAEHAANAERLGTRVCRVCTRFAIPPFAECAFHVAVLEFRYERTLTDD